MADPNDSLKRQIKRLLLLDQKDLLRLIANEPDVQDFVQRMDKDHAYINTRSAKHAQIFLSYARPNADLVGQLYDRLAADGYIPWMDTKSLFPGEKWVGAIQRAIRQSDFFILCLSKNSANRRGFIQKEIRIALEILDEMLDDDIYLIPVRLEECKVPDSLGNVQWVNLFEDDGYARLVHAIHEGEKRRNLVSGV